jgi:hypothetical protein
VGDTVVTPASGQETPLLPESVSGIQGIFDSRTRKVANRDVAIKPFSGSKDPQGHVIEKKAFSSSLNGLRHVISCNNHYIFSYSSIYRVNDWYLILSGMKGVSPYLRQLMLSRACTLE